MRSLYISKRIINQLLKDKRTLGLLIFAPLFILFLLYTIFNSSISTPCIQTIGLPSDMQTAFEKETKLTAVTDETSAMNALKNKSTDAVVVYTDPDIDVYVEGSDTSVTAAVKKALASAMSSYIKDHVQAEAEKKIDEQKQKISDDIDKQVKSIQDSVTGEIQSQQEKIKSDIEGQMTRKIDDMKDTIKSKIKSQLKSALKSKVKSSVDSVIKKQQAAVAQQLASYQAGLSQTISQSMQSYTKSVQKAIQDYLNKIGASNSGAVFEMPAFSMPAIAPPDIKLPNVSLSISIPSVDLSDIDMPSVSMPEITAPVIDSSDIKVPDISVSLDVSEINYSYINGSDNISTFDSIAPYMMGFFVFFFVFIIAGIAFLRERISGTLDRVLATPVRRYEIVLGYFIGFGIFVFLQTLLIQFFMVYVLNITIKGSFILVLVTNLLLATCSLSLGTFLSAFARNEMQMFQFIPIIIVPQVMFCGMFSLRDAPVWVQVLSDIFPLTYGAQALNDVSVRGLGFSAIALNLSVLVIFTVLFLALNTLVLKKYRRL